MHGFAFWNITLLFTCTYYVEHKVNWGYRLLSSLNMFINTLENHTILYMQSMIQLKARWKEKERYIALVLYMLNATSYELSIKNMIAISQQMVYSSWTNCIWVYDIRNRSQDIETIWKELFCYKLLFCFLNPKKFMNCIT